MKNENEFNYYERIKDWDFDMFEIETESLTNWNLYDVLKKIITKDSKILDLGTGGGEKLLKEIPKCKEIIGTDISPSMIETANRNLKKAKREEVTFKIMDNLNMDVPENYFDIVIARNTVTDPTQIFKCLKKGGYLLIGGVDKDDCYRIKMIFGKGQAYNDTKPISIIDYENVLNAGFSDVELIPIHERECFKNKYLFKEFLKKVPIIKDFSEMSDDDKDCYYDNDIDDELLDKYIKENTHDGKILLLRRYYGIVSRKK